MNYIIYKDSDKWKRTSVSFDTFSKAKYYISELQDYFPKRQYDILFAKSFKKLKEKLNEKNN